MLGERGIDLSMDDCIFCKIASGEIPTDFVYEDEDVAIFRDVAPQAPTHLLAVPKQHVASSIEVSDPSLWSALLGRAVEAAHALGLDESGYRMVINTGAQGGQTVPHLHLHLLSGRDLGWPPG